MVTLSAAPAVGSRFTGWSGNPDCTDGLVAMNTAHACTAAFALETGALECVAFSPYVQGYSPLSPTGPHPPPALIDALLDDVVANTTFRCIMTYGVLNGLSHAFEAAKQRGLKVVAILWLDNDPAVNAASIDQGIQKAKEYPDTIIRVACGSEVRTRRGAALAETTIQSCRTQLAAAGVTQPVGTIDTWWALCNEQRPCQTWSLAANMDWIGANVYAWWENKFSGFFTCTPAADAAAFHLARIEEVKTRYPSREVIATEFGWPAGPDGYSEQNRFTGQRCGIASEVNQDLVVDGTVALLRQADISHVVFEALREPWKSVEGPVGPFWGLRDASHTITFSMAPGGAPNPVASAEIVNVATAASDSFAHSVSYGWTASCPTLGSNGSFGSPAAASSTWTAPVNLTGIVQPCTIGVTVSDGQGLSQSASYQQTVNSVPHTLTITSGPSGTPNPVTSGGAVAATVGASDSLLHALIYGWTATCATLGSNGSFSNPTIAAPTWTAPANTTGVVQPCTIGVTVSDGQGLSQTASYQQTVSAAPCVFTLAPPSASFPAAAGTGTTTLSTQVSCGWTAISTAPWITVTTPPSGTGPITIGYTVTANTGATRSGSILVAGQTFNITQAALAVGPTADNDADGLPDEWELSFGLDPLAATGDNGPAADPDGDGISNLEERRAGSHPRGFYRRYFAEGATSAFFNTLLALLNTAAEASHVLLQFQLGNGSVVTKVVTVPGHTRVTVDPKTISGLATAEFSTVVESDVTVVADRTMSWDQSGYGAHAETSLPSPRTTWYLAEGATHSGFDLFYLLQNATTTPATVQIQFLRPAPAAPVTKTYVVAPNSRSNVWVDTEPELAATDVSAIVTSNVPIIVERAMYLNRAGQLFAAGHESAAIADPQTHWLLAEGATGPYFDLFVLVANPNDAAATLTVRFLLPSGEVVPRTYVVGAKSRFNIWVDAEGGVLADTAVSTEITADLPVLVERSMWWPGPTAAEWSEAHNSAGATATGTVWALAEGEQGGTRASDTYILIANTSAFGGSARVTLYFEDGTSAQQVVPLLPNSRVNVAVGAPVASGGFGPAVTNKRFGAVVESLASNGNVLAPQIVVERAIYSNAGGIVWAAGTNALATKMQ